MDQELYPRPTPLFRRYKILFVIAGGLLILLILLGGSFFRTQETTQTPDEFADQEINETLVNQPGVNNRYSNTKVKFSFRYPTRFGQPFTLTKEGRAQKLTGTEESSYIVFSDKTEDTLGLSVFPYNGTLENLPNSQADPRSDTGSTQNEVKKQTINGLETLWIESVPAKVYALDGVVELKIYFVRNNHGFVLTTNKDRSTQEVEEILESFSFS